MIIVTGQTATGKTALAQELANENNGELINFDSRQIYKHLDIITGKDLEKNSNLNIKSSKSGSDIGYYELTTNHQSPATKVWLYDIVTPDKYFSSFDFAQLARGVIEDITARGKTPILVGGSYLYLKHLLYDFDVKVPPDFVLRDSLNKKTVTELQTQLKKMSIGQLETMNNSDRNNPRRLIRKIEILSNPKPVTKSVSIKESEKSINNLGISSYIGIRYEKREDLAAAIKNRVKKRIENGAIGEVEKLLKSGYTEKEPGLKTIGYREVIKYLRGDLTYDQAIAEWVNHEIQYAKRQYTFMKKDKNISWKTI